MDGSTDIPICGNEPIHVPGSIQPHGMLLVATRAEQVVVQIAGSVEERLGTAEWQGAPLSALVGPDIAAAAAAFVAAAPSDSSPHAGFVGTLRDTGGQMLDVSAHLAGLAGSDGPRDLLVLELEPAEGIQRSAPALLDSLDHAAAAFERAVTLAQLCEAGAAAFRRMTGFDRVLIYRFDDDDAGSVLGEDRVEEMPSFLNHHFPASDIPPQARALYARNLVRVIPDIHYTPAELRPPAPGAPLDMSDSSLRSVSPVHLQYLFNMGVAASASFSIVKDGLLWGLVACHHRTARAIPYERRAGCRTLAGALGRALRTQEDADSLRQRLRLRAVEDEVARLLGRDETLDEALDRHATEICRALGADGVAVLRRHEVVTGGNCPPRAEIRALGHFVREQMQSRGGEHVFATDELCVHYPPAGAFTRDASGLLALVLSPDEPWMILWFRAEQIETVRWAGDPHKDVSGPMGYQLNPRVSFEDWIETVRGRSRRWTLPEQEAASRLRTILLKARQERRMGELNRQLTTLLDDKDRLLQQKEFLMGEANHRVQNSLQLVSSFLGSQARSSNDPRLRGALEEAGRRMAAVGLVHRRLYRGDQVEMIDAGLYLAELCEDTLRALGGEWRPHLVQDLASLMISSERAVPMGLVLTELVININKYAYGGQPGPVLIRLTENRTQFVLTVADNGCGRQETRPGFGSRMMAALVSQLGGTLAYHDNRPGTRATLIAPTARPLASPAGTGDASADGSASPGMHGGPPSAAASGA